jgi:hypothetical protein
MGKSLCDWSKKDIEKHFEELCRVTADPRFTCRKCARSAHEARHLCKPRPRPASLPGPGTGESAAGRETGTPGMVPEEEAVV